MNTAPSAPFQNDRTTQSAYTPQGKRVERPERAVQGWAARFAYRIECRESAVKGHRERCKAGQRALPIGLRVGKARGRPTESSARPGSALCLPDCVQGKRGKGSQRAVQGQGARFAYRIECRESAVKSHRERCMTWQRALPTGLNAGKAR